MKKKDKSSMSKVWDAPNADKEDPDQPAHPHRLMRTLSTERIIGYCITKCTWVLSVAAASLATVALYCSYMTFRHLSHHVAHFHFVLVSLHLFCLKCQTSDMQALGKKVCRRNCQYQWSAVFEPQRQKTFHRLSAPSEHSDQLAHL